MRHLLLCKPSLSVVLQGTLDTAVRDTICFAYIYPFVNGWGRALRHNNNSILGWRINSVLYPSKLNHRGDGKRRQWTTLFAKVLVIINHFQHSVCDVHPDQKSNSNNHLQRSYQCLSTKAEVKCSQNSHISLQTTVVLHTKIPLHYTPSQLTKKIYVYRQVSNMFCDLVHVLESLPWYYILE